MIVKYKKTYENQVFALIMQTLGTSLLLLVGAICIVSLEVGGFNLVKIFTSKSNWLIVLAFIILLMDIAKSFILANEDKKRTGGLYGEYILELTDAYLDLTYQDQIKRIPWKDVRSIKIDNSFIMINFGDKDVLITISKHYLHNPDEYKALKKYFLKKKSSMVKKFIFK